MAETMEVSLTDVSPTRRLTNKHYIQQDIARLIDEKRDVLPSKLYNYNYLPAFILRSLSRL